MNSIRKILASTAQTRSPQESAAIEEMLNITQKYSEKYIITGTSTRGLCTAKMSLSMKVKSVSINREKFAQMQSMLSWKPNNAIHEVTCAMLEEEILSALQNAVQKFTKKVEKSSNMLIQNAAKNSTSYEEIGEFTG